MNEEQKYESVEGLKLVAGKDKFERSENLSFPAGPPSEPLVSPGEPPAEPRFGGLDPDEDWEDDRPPARQSTDEGTGLADSLSWADVPLPPSQSTALVIEVVRAAIAGYGVPAEILTDNGTQYVTWRGKSQFTRELEKLGIRQIVARPKRPQTLGKIERFWGTLWRECIESAVFVDLEDARRRIGLFIDHYNFQRVHSGIDGLVPADRFFHAAPEVLATLKERVTAHALELSRHGVPKQPFYLTGQVAGQPFSVHQQGDRVILRQADQAREEIELVPPPVPQIATTELPPAVCPQGVPESYGALPSELPPGVSALDDYLSQQLASDEGGAS